MDIIVIREMEIERNHFSSIKNINNSSAGQDINSCSHMLLVAFLESNLAVATEIENKCCFDKAISLGGVCALEIKHLYLNMEWM